ncbi:FAD:protein FMN transferase [Polaribacter sp.]|uniref:FAD:protein FMN transferase n=1 Tax=Polaribacter sp. TaxID=1920175 RepID=UPI003F4AD34F
MGLTIFYENFMLYFCALIYFWMKPKSLLVFLFLFFVLIGCTKKPVFKDFTLKGMVFGTSYKITYLNGAKNYQKSLDSIFFLVNKSLSTYIPTSDISKINKGDSTIVVDDLFLEVFQKSTQIYKETDGFFDPTVGNLVNAYGFGPEKGNIVLEENVLKEQMQWVGLNKVKIINKKVIKEDDHIYIDFNSIAKGFGIDVVARFFDDKKINNYLIEIGGEIRAKGAKKNNHPWIIKLVNPVKIGSEKGYKKLNLSNKSMATSGNYRKFRITQDGKKFVHTINPKTGLATESNLLSASVIAGLDCANVDAYATAFMAMGLEKTKEFLQNHSNLDVILIYANSNGVLEEFSTYKQSGIVVDVNK